MAASASALEEDGDQAAPRRAVSVSLCSDSYVLALGGPQDVAALSWQVDHAMSAAPDWARRLPRAWNAADRLLALQPGLAVFGPGEGGRAADALRRAGAQSVSLIWSEDFDGVKANLRLLGQAWGNEVEAETVIADLDRRLADLDRRAEARGWTPSIAYLSASGASAGEGSFVDAVIRAAGGRNAASEAGLSGWGRADPAFALRLDPDLVVTSFFIDGYASILNRGMRHAAYRRLLEGRPRLDIPAGDWPCAGPRLIEAAEALADALDALPADRGRRGDD